MVSALAQPYGHYLYPQPGIFLSDASVTSTKTNGHLLVGYKPQTTPPNYNFCVVKTDAAGTFSPGSFSFKSEYQVLHSAGCGTTSPIQLNNCAGVSGIETNVPGSPSGWYALAGASDETCFFSLIDSSGNAITSVAFPFSYTCSSCVGKPSICESASSPNNYYICGGIDTSIYVLKINAAGAIQWSSYYSVGDGNYFTPKAIRECPFSGDLIIIGGVNPPASYSRGTDGFFLKLNPGNGNVIMYKTYSFSTGACQEFSCIKPAYSPTGGQGFVLGGYTDTYPGAPWFVKLDTAGNLIWSTVVEPSLDAGAQPATGIVERLNTGQYEYYAVVRSFFNGMLVLKLDDNGILFVGSSNEFLFNAGAPFASSPAAIDFQNAGNNIALCTYGTNNGIQGGNLYMVRSYFNGKSGCSETCTTVANYYSGPDSIISPWINKYGSISACTNFQITSKSITPTLTAICSNTFVPGGNNNILTSISNKSEHTTHALITPNPTSGKIRIFMDKNYRSSNSILLFNAKGQPVKSFDITLKEEDFAEIDLTPLHLESGFYLVKIISGNSVYSGKIIYSK